MNFSGSKPYRNSIFFLIGIMGVVEYTNHMSTPYLTIVLFVKIMEIIENTNFASIITSAVDVHFI